jgi:predicted alpha/beta hydrolase
MSNPLSITCQDGTVLGAIRYEPSQATRAELLMGGATGVPQGFYRRFAEFANAQGFAVTTLDYRGIGASAPKTLKGYKVDYLDWGRQDLSAALDNICARYPSANTVPVAMIGHSYGGHGFGLMPNHAKVKAFYTFASGAGWAGHMPPTERFKVGLLWNVLGPLVVPALGYMPGKFIGGENLPKDVYRQWRRWCSFPNYFFDDPEMPQMKALFAQVKTPIMAATAIDDLWAPPISRDYFFRGYSGAAVTHLDIDPNTLPKTNGQQGIGHMGYFRKGREQLWADALAWCEAKF